MIRITSGIIFLCTLLLLSYGKVSGQTEEIEQDTSANVWSTWLSNTYELNYPSLWDVDTTGLMGTHIILLSPQEGNDDLFRENLNLMIQDLTGYNLNMDQFIEYSENQLPMILNDAKMHVSKRHEKNGSEYHEMLYSATQGHFHIKTRQFCWIKGNEAYVLTFSAESDQYEKYKDIGDKLLHSFVIK